MVSFRGAIAFENKIIRKEMKKKTSPCLSCNAPYQKSCPVNAISRDRYSVSYCLNFINNSNENSCSNGCLVRGSCPIGESLRKTEQSNII